MALLNLNGIKPITQPSTYSTPAPLLALPDQNSANNNNSSPLDFSQPSQALSSPPLPSPPSTYLGKLGQAAQQGLGDIGTLWDMSNQEGFIPGTWHKTLAGLTALDMPRRMAFKAVSSSPLTEAGLNALGVEHPSDLSSGQELGNELSEAWGKKTGAFDYTLPSDAGFLQGLAYRLNPQRAYIPLVQGIGNALDIYSDPLLPLSGGRSPIRAAVEGEWSRPFLNPLTRGTEFPSMVTRGEFNPELAAQHYTQSKLMDSANNLLQARQLLPTYEDPAIRQEATRAIQAYEQRLGEISQDLRSPAYQQELLQARSGGSLPSQGETTVKGLSTGVNIPLQEQTLTGLTDLTSLDKTNLPSELRNLLPKELETASTPLYAQEQVKLEKMLAEGGPGLRYFGQLIPGTDKLASLGARAYTGARDLVNKFFFGEPYSKDISPLSTPLPPEHPAVQALQQIDPSYVGQAITPNDIQAYLNFATGQPGGLGSFANARDFLSRVEGDSDPVESLNRLKPLVDLQEALNGPTDPLATTRAFNEALSAAQSGKAQDPFFKSIPELNQAGVTFEDLQQANKQRIYPWLVRQMKNHFIPDDMLINYGVSPDQVEAVKNRLSTPAPGDPLLAQAIEPDLDRLSFHKTTDDLIRVHSEAVAQQMKDLANASTPLAKLQSAFQTLKDNTAFAQEFPTIIQRMASQLQYTPPPFLLHSNPEMQLRGLRQHLDTLGLATMDLHDQLHQFWQQPGGRILDLLTAGSDKISDALLGRETPFDSPQELAKAISDKLGPDLSLAHANEINQFADMLHQVGGLAQDQWGKTLSDLDATLGHYKGLQNSFQEAIAPIRAISNAQLVMARPYYDQFLLSSLGSLNEAKNLLFNRALATPDNKARIWMGFQDIWTNFTRSVLRDYGWAPEIVQQVHQGYTAQDYWKGRAEREADDQLTRGLYRNLLQDYKIPWDWRKQNQLDEGFARIVGYKPGISNDPFLESLRLERQAQGKQFILDAMNGNQAAANDALQRMDTFWKTNAQRMSMGDQAMGMAAKPNYLEMPQMLQRTDIGTVRKMNEALKAYPQQQFADLAEYEKFLDWASGRGVDPRANLLAPPNLVPELSLQRLYAQKLSNHYVGISNHNFLRDLSIAHPDLIRELGVDSPTVLGPDYARDVVPRAIGLAAPDGMPSTFNARADFYKYLESFVPFTEMNEPKNPIDYVLRWASYLQSRLNMFNVTYNALGHVKNILADSLMGGVDFGLVGRNLKAFGPNPELNPLFDEAARQGVFPYGGVDFHRPIQEVMDIRMAQPFRGPIDNPIIYSATSPGLNVQLGNWTLLRTPDVGLDRMAGFLARLREPEYFRHLTWDVIDKQMRLALYQQGLEMGMSKPDAVAQVKNALIDYQMGWHNAKTKAYAQAFFPFYSWWVGNLKFHLPNMLANPRMYLIANHLANLANWYSTGHSRDENPTGVGSAVALPVNNGPELLYWQLGLPWDSIQTKIYKNLYDTWTAPSVGSDPLDFLARMRNTAMILPAYIKSRATSIPSTLLKDFYGAQKPQPGANLPNQDQNQGLIPPWISDMVGRGLWGVSQAYGPWVENALSYYDPSWDWNKTGWWRGALGQIGPVERQLPTGEVKSF